MAPLLDRYAMIDWSAASSRRRGRDSIWIAHGAARCRTLNPSSRREAYDVVRRLIIEPDRGRVLVGFDFGFGYPAGFAAALELTRPPWLATWRFLSERVEDDAGNRNNRFAVADAINAALDSGPFWCAPRPGALRHVPQRRAPCSLPPLRETDRRAGSDTPFRLYGQGSVGGQMLLGIPYLHRLRFDPALAGETAVWPFETGWAPPGPGVRVVLAEIYPSLLAPRHGSCRDEGQVRAAWAWARDLDRRGALAGEFGPPDGATAAMLEEEGWILGTPTGGE